jgi:hypothetical protein
MSSCKVGFIINQYRWKSELCYVVYRRYSIANLNNELLQQPAWGFSAYYSTLFAKFKMSTCLRVCMRVSFRWASVEWSAKDNYT